MKHVTIRRQPGGRPRTGETAGYWSAGCLVACESGQATRLPKNSGEPPTLVMPCDGARINAPPESGPFRVHAVGRRLVKPCAHKQVKLVTIAALAWQLAVRVFGRDSDDCLTRPNVYFL